MKTRFEKALEQLYSFLDYERLTNPAPFNTCRYDLGQFRGSLDILGNPQLAYPTVHIAGSKGKGSTAAMVESILRSGGYRTGLFTSPHLVDVRERIRIDGEPVSAEIFAPHIEEIAALAREEGKGKNYRTVFEILTAAAFRIFAEINVDIAIVEAGLGGYLDATNVMRPEITVITTIGLDHTNILGNTIGEIASGKAGIFQRDVPVVLGVQGPEARKILRERARKTGTGKITEIGVDCVLEGVEIDSRGTVFSIRLPDSRLQKLYLPLLGEFQAENGATAVATTLALRDSGFDISEKTVRDGLRCVVWPGRMQMLAGFPEILVDGAHSPMSLERLGESIEKIWPEKRIVCVFATNRDKDIRGMLKIVRRFADSIVLTRFDWPRAADTSFLKSMADFDDIAIYETPNTADAIRLARKLSRSGDLIVVTGSLYLVGEVLRLET